MLIMHVLVRICHSPFSVAMIQYSFTKYLRFNARSKRRLHPNTHGASMWVVVQTIVLAPVSHSCGTFLVFTALDTNVLSTVIVCELPYTGSTFAILYMWHVCHSFNWRVVLKPLVSWSSYEYRFEVPDLCLVPPTVASRTQPCAPFVWESTRITVWLQEYIDTRNVVGDQESNRWPPLAVTIATPNAWLTFCTQRVYK
jgi:hypothetical protein